MFRSIFRTIALFCLLLPAQAQWVAPNPPASFTRQHQYVVFTLKEGFLKLQVCSDSLVRVIYSREAETPDRGEDVIVKKDWPDVKWTVLQSQRAFTVATGRMRVAVARSDGSLTFSDLAGRRLLQEGPNTLTPVVVNGEKAYRSEAVIGLWGSAEAFYGLGQHQSGAWNYHGDAVDLSQENASASVPLMISSNGYGILWNNASRSRFNNHSVNTMYVTAEVADSIDYYFLYGPEADLIIAAYRELTGAAPLFGKWAYGFWQSKSRYKSQDELMAVARIYRSRHIPVDNIVQDSLWWVQNGGFEFNKNYPDPKAMMEELHRLNFHTMISVSSFLDAGSANYDEMDKAGYLIDRANFGTIAHLPGMALYDAFNAKARQFLWNLMDRSLFRIGVDAWSMDGVEPETEGREENILAGNRVAIGNGARYTNLYPLMAARQAYEGQRTVSNQKRVFILSSSAYAGSQRYGTAVRPGEVNSDWESFRRQIPAGLNFSLSGMPYWSPDIGGFVNGNPGDSSYRELFVRWFQYGTFCPIMRVHGNRLSDQNEIWSYGPEVQRILGEFDRLRYEMLPYLYSLAWKVTHDGYTIMRPLVMDYRTDARAQNTGDEFLFGPAILVSPVTEPGAVTRHLYLPKAKWYDFWTGQITDGGKSVDVAATLEKIPLFVRAGSIVPIGPDVEFATQKAPDEMELRVYRGVDASFTLYEDENDGYGYEAGAFSTVPFEWREADQTLTIGERSGSFPGMLQTRRFRVVFVRDSHGTGIGVDSRPDRNVAYEGKAITIRP